MKRMNSTYITLLQIVVSTLLAGNIYSQDMVQFSSRSGVGAVSVRHVDTVKYGTENTKVVLSWSPDSIREMTFEPGEIPDLTQNDVQTTGNQLLSVSLTSESNPLCVYRTVAGVRTSPSGYAGGFDLFVPYLTDLSRLSLSFQSNGSVYCNGVLQKSGASVADFSEPQLYKVVDDKGNVATYQVRVYNSGLPVVQLTTASEEKLTTNWSENHSLEVYMPEGALHYKGIAELKYKGSKYSLSEKRSYGIKLSKKTQLLEMSKGKRWLLYSNADDASLLRTAVACKISSLTELKWTPSVQPVEVVEDDSHKGSYLLMEEPRLASDRVDGKALLSIDTEWKSDADYLKGEKSGLIFKIEDASDEYTKAEVQSVVNGFEEKLYGDGDCLSAIDLSSFVDAYLLTEIFKDKEALSSSMFYIMSDGTIAYGPIASQEDQLGNENESYEGWVLRTHPWFERLWKNASFVALLSSRFEMLKSAIETMDYRDELTELSLSYSSDSLLYTTHHSASMEQELKKVTDWLASRLQWLSVRISNESLSVAEELATENNKITSFSLSKSKNSVALLSDYTATITDDSVKIFVPYLVHFDLTPEFTVSNGATVYVEGEKQESGESVNNYLRPVVYHVVAAGGQVRHYTVSIYNSGISVLYVNTPNNQSVTSKDTWVDGTSMTAYLCDGTVDYDASPDLAQIKGRGNSTWSATSEKRPYAIKLNKKHRVYGMLEHKRWVLLANYYDATFFRNEFSNYLSKHFTTADWSPSGEFVEYVLNDKHLGNYYFCEQAKICDARVPGEYLVEADLKDGKGQIKGVKSGNYFNVKHPEVADDSQELQYVKELLDNFETALYSGDWEKVKTLIDLNSFADWYVIKELSKDYDGNMYTSCYCHIMEDGIIKMGPIWDFDLAWGGNPFETMMGSWGGTDYGWYNEPEDYYIGEREQSTGTNWFLKFLQQKEFLQLVLERLDLMTEHLDEILAYIDEYTERLTLSASANTVGYSGTNSFGGWGMWGGTTTTTEEKTYAEKMAVIKTFFKERLSWMKKDLESR